VNIGRAGNHIWLLLDIAFEERFKPAFLGNDAAINEENDLPASLTRTEILLFVVVKALTGTGSHSPMEGRLLGYNLG
jgi:hypothetical protein